MATLKKMRSTPINQTKTLWVSGKGDVVTKNCENLAEAFLFERDMPAKHGVLFTKTPYIIKTIYN